MDRRGPVEPYDIETMGERFTGGLNFSFLPGTPDFRVEAGEYIVPALLKTPSAKTYAALHLVHADFHYAIECLKEADKMGIPAVKNLPQKALIQAAIVAYARPFATGVRAIRMGEDHFKATKGFDLKIHQFLIAVRSQNIAHSVNDFEFCETITMMIGSPQTGWRNVSAVGVAESASIGVSRAILLKSIDHISAALAHIDAEKTALMKPIYEEFAAQYALDGKWEQAPVGHVPDRDNPSKPRSR